MATIRRPLLCIALAALAAAGCDSTARTIAGQPSPEGAGCTGCHGVPPATASHDPSMSIQACATCHPGTVLPTGELDSSSTLHLDGKVDVSAFHPDTWSSPTEHGQAAMTQLGACATCHGPDFAGGSSGVSCNACHQAAGHASWTTDCTFCHANPPSTGEHTKHVTDKRIACTVCHAGVMTTPDVTAGSALHANGEKNVVFSGAGTWDASTKTCSSVGCHGSESW